MRRSSRGIRAREQKVDRLDRPSSLRLLAQTAAIAPEELPAEADAIADECGDVALALALAASMIEGRQDWNRVLETLQTADWEQIDRDFAGYPYPHVFAAIEASVDALGADGGHYLDLAIFPDGVPVPQGVLELLWADLKPLQVRKLMARLRDRSLARVEAHDRLVLHDLQRDFVRKRVNNLPVRHERLIEAYHRKGVDRELPLYFRLYLPYHLGEAGRLDERDALLQHYEPRDQKEMLAYEFGPGSTAAWENMPQVARDDLIKAMAETAKERPNRSNNSLNEVDKMLTSIIQNFKPD